MADVKVTLKPVFEENDFQKMEGLLDIDGLKAESGKYICYFQIETVSIPGCRPENLQITDEKGPFPVRRKKRTNTPTAG